MLNIVPILNGASAAAGMIAAYFWFWASLTPKAGNFVVADDPEFTSSMREIAVKNRFAATFSGLAALCSTIAQIVWLAH
jgi:hypothetical protein